MSGPSVTIRCVRCGRFLVAPAPPGRDPAWFSCPHCAQPVPVVAPRDPAPLFSWEVYPHLYPPANPPRVPGPGVARLLVALLLTATVVLGGLAGGLGWAGVASLRAGGFPVRGVVIDALGSSNAPAFGAIVNLTSETGMTATVVTGVDGTFLFPSVPAGGIALNITQAGYGPLQVQLFASSVYASPGIAGTLHVSLVPGFPDNTTYESLTPFGDLNGFLTSLWSSSVLLSFGAIVAAVGTLAAYRDRRFQYAVAGASAAVAGPLAPGLLGVTAVFPVVTWFAGLVVASGVAAFAIAAVRLATVGATPPAEE
ncbi:MAG: carboxypeptidase-like regulatory domain-containing protein [Thermoplasmata archaeon]|nr:carboxypeptidase-like regulatory domain-containing protein [Thermoplasmata archaeon]